MEVQMKRADGGRDKGGGGKVGEGSGGIRVAYGIGETRMCK